MKILSLFDGMACGRIALGRAGIDVEAYHASEIDKYAMQVANSNYPDIVQIGDVCKVDGTKYQDFDMLIGGSPCQGFSFAGKQLNFDDPRSALFFEYVRILKEMKPRWFLLENVVMKKEYQDVISKQLGVSPVKINSALVSAQTRKRLYWTNIPGIRQPEDKGILLKDIIEDAVTEKDKSYAIDAHYGKGTNLEYYLKRNKRQIVFIQQKGHGNNKGGVKAKDGKCPSLTSNSWEDNNHVVFCARKIGRYLKDGVRQDHKMSVAGLTTQRIEPRTDGKTNALTSVQKDNLICVPQATKKGYVEVRPGECVDLSYPESKTRRGRLMVNKSNCLMAETDTQFHYCNNDLTFRKLTPLECERLQTAPDNYTEGVSNTQRYRMLGNGWTVDVIAHIFRHIPECAQLPETCQAHL